MFIIISFQSDWILADAENLNAMREDLNKILKGPQKTERKFYIMCALSDLTKLLRTACKTETTNKTQFAKQFPEPTVALIEKEKIKSCLKKLDYYLSFTKDCLEL